MWGRPRARYVILADATPHHTAAGAQSDDTQYRQQLYRVVQGYHIGVYCRHLRFPQNHRSCARGSQMVDAGYERNRLHIRRLRLLRLLLCDVEICDRHREEAICGRKAMSMSAGSATDACAVEITALHKWFGEFHVLADINLKVGRGERIVICGPSGSGKSTLLRCINRLEDFQHGEIVVDGMVLTRDIRRVDAVRREVGMVFQHFNLFPHLTVLETCSLAPIQVRGMPKREAQEPAMHFLKPIKIPEQTRKYPNQLSAGHQHRLPIPPALSLRPNPLTSHYPPSP